MHTSATNNETQQSNSQKSKKQQQQKHVHDFSRKTHQISGTLAYIIMEYIAFIYSRPPINACYDCDRKINDLRAFSKRPQRNKKPVFDFKMCIRLKVPLVKPYAVHVHILSIFYFNDRLGFFDLLFRQFTTKFLHSLGCLLQRCLCVYAIKQSQWLKPVEFSTCDRSNWIFNGNTLFPQYLEKISRHCVIDFTLIHPSVSANFKLSQNPRLYGDSYKKIFNEAFCLSNMPIICLGFSFNSVNLKWKFYFVCRK